MLSAEIEEKVETFNALVTFLEEGCYGSANVQKGNEYQEDFLEDDQPIPSSKNPSVHDIVDPEEKCGDESLETLHLIKKIPMRRIVVKILFQIMYFLLF